MADAVATYRVDLEDGVAGPAGTAAKALEGLQKQLNQDTAALREMESAFKRLNAGQVVNIDAAKRLRDAISAKKQAIAEAQGAIVQMGGGLGRLAGQGKGALSFVERVQAAAKAAPGPLAALTARLGGLSGVLKAGAIAVGLIALAAAVVAVTVATVAGAAALLRYGVAQADARRNELLRLEGLTKLRFWYGAAAGSASDLQNATDKVAASTAIGRDQVARYTEQLYRAGLRGQGLEEALDAVAIKASVQGEAAASSFASWAAGTALAGGSVKRLADDVRARLGGIAARQMLSLEVQTRKLHESYSALSKGLNLEPLLKGLKSVTELFSQNTESGRALRDMLTRLFQPVIDGAEGAGLYVRRFFQGMIIAALKTENVILRLRLWFRDTFGGSLLGALDLTRAAVIAGYIAFGLVATVLGAVALAIGAVGVALAALVAPFAGAIALGYHLTLALKELWTLDWVGLGKAIASGIVRGIKTGAAWVLDTMRDLGAKAYQAFKQKLGIASPSKEFAKLGVALPQGVAAGVDKGTPDAQRAVERMVNVPDLPSLGRGGREATPARAGRETSITIDVGGVTVQTAASTPSTLASDLEAQLQRVFERVALQLGAKLGVRNGF